MARLKKPSNSRRRATPATPPVQAVAPTTAAPTLDQMLARQATLNLSIPPLVTIVGVGGVGSWIALFLALAGVRELWLFDNDTVSDHNLNRLPLPITAIGKRKSDAIAEEIIRLRPDCHPLPFPNFTEALARQLGLNRGWLVAATDSLQSRRDVYHFSQHHFAMSYMEAAAEGEWGSVTDSPAEFSTPEETQPGYASVPVHVGPCVMAASLTAYHILHGTRPSDRVIRLGWDTEHANDFGIGRFDAAIMPPYPADPPASEDTTTMTTGVDGDFTLTNTVPTPPPEPPPEEAYDPEVDDFDREAVQEEP